MNTKDQIIITSGAFFTDIDAYSCAIAYNKLLNKLEYKATSILPGKLNESVSQTVRSWEAEFCTSKPDKPEEYSYILVDISEPKYFANFVIEENIVQLFDHRESEYKKYWKDKLKQNAFIEDVGSCTTLIWEEYVKNGMQDSIDSISANLIYTSTISNTLYLQSQNTSQRDLKTLEEIKNYTSLPTKWDHIYFSEVEESVLENPSSALESDTKQREIHGNLWSISQLELWDSNLFLDKYKDEIYSNFGKFDSDYSFFTSPCISEGKNYLTSKDKYVQKLLSNAIGVRWKGDIGQTDKLWLRKEIIRELERGRS